MFMDRSLERLRSVAGYPDVTIWTSSLTTEKYIDDLRTEDYTIQGDLNFLIVRDLNISLSQYGSTQSIMKAVSRIDSMAPAVLPTSPTENMNQAPLKSTE